MNNYGVYDYKLNGNPKGASPENETKIAKSDNRQGTLNEQLKYWKGQKRDLTNEDTANSNEYHLTQEDTLIKDSKTNDYMISALEMELEILNYKNFVNYAENAAHNRLITYFRSTLQKRIIGCHMICETLKGKWTLQSEIHDIYNITRSAISQVVKECIEETWFVSKICKDHHQNQLCYKVGDQMLHGTFRYTNWKFRKGNNSKMVRFVKNHNNHILDELMCSEK